MVDPLSIGTSVIGSTVPAPLRSRLLLDDLQSIVDAPKALETFTNSIGSMLVDLAPLLAVKDEGGNYSRTLLRKCRE
jgi:hypothetical protein